MRKVYLKVEFKIAVRLEEGVEIGDFISDMNYEFVSLTEGANIFHEELIDYEVTNNL